MDAWENRLLGPVILSIGGPIFLLLARSIIRRHRRLGRCVPTVARVVAFKEWDPRGSEDETNRNFVAYQFHVKGGKEFVATSLNVRSSPPYELGEMAAILYDPADPGWIVIDRWVAKYGLHAFSPVFTLVFVIAGLLMTITGRGEWHWELSFG